MDIDIQWQRGHDPDAMQAALDEFLEALADEVEAAIDRLMEDVLETVQRLAPVDTGQLRDSYQSEVQEGMEAAMGLIIEGIAYTNVEYAPFQEFLDLGTPHVAPALEEHRSQLESEAEQAWNKAVKEVS